MNQSFNRLTDERQSRYDILRTYNWLNDKMADHKIAEGEVDSDWSVDDPNVYYNTQGASYDYLKGDIDTGTFQSSTHIPIKVDRPTVPIIDDHLSEVGGTLRPTFNEFTQFASEVDTIPSDAKTEQATRISVDQHPLSTSGTTGTISGTVDIPSGAATERYTLIDSVSFRHYEELIDEEDQDLIEKRVEVTGQVLGASSGTVSVYLLTDQYYFQGSASVNADGTFSVDVRDGDFWNDSDVRIRHPSTREWAPGAESRYIYSDYTVEVYRLVDKYYKQSETFINTDGTWSTTGTGNDGVPRVRCTGPADIREWRNIYQSAQVYSNYKVNFGYWTDREYNVSSSRIRVSDLAWSLTQRGNTGLNFLKLIDNSGADTKIRGLPWWHDVNDGEAITGYELRVFSQADQFYHVRTLPLSPIYTDYTLPKVLTGATLIQVADNDYSFTSQGDLNGLTFGRDNAEVTDTIKASAITDTGVSRSYDIPYETTGVYTSNFPHRAYTYDIALHIIANILQGNNTEAENGIAALCDTQENASAESNYATRGVMPFFIQVGSEEGYYLYERTGAASWVAYAYLLFIDKVGTSARGFSVVSKFQNLYSRLQDFQVGDPDSTIYPLYRGGRGAFKDEDDDGIYETFDETAYIPWVATEHQVDMWFVLKRAAQTFGDTVWDTRAVEQRQGMLNILWSDGLQRYYQGSTDTDIDDRGALDAHTWAGVQLVGWDEFDKAKEAAQKVQDRYKLTGDAQGLDFPPTGYSPYTEEEGHYSATDQVWFEGTFGAALFWRRMEEQGLGEWTLRDADGNVTDIYRVDGFHRGWNIGSNQTVSGAYKYALRGQFDSADLVDFPSIASTAWAAITMEHYDKDFWREGAL